MSCHPSGRNRNRGNDIKLAVTLLAFACIGGCTTGSAVATGQERSPIDPATVTLYDEPPTDYEVIGIVEAASDVLFFIFFDKSAIERAFAELKEQAAKIGANGVIDWEIGEIEEWVPHYDSHTGIYSTSRRITKTVMGTAIFVTSNRQSE